MALKPPSHGGQPRQVNADHMAETAKTLIRDEINDYRLGFGFSDLRELLYRRTQTPNEIRPADEQTAIELSKRVRRITETLLQDFSKRYIIKTIQLSYQDALGDASFRGGSEVPTGTGGWDLVETILKVSEKAIDSMEASVLIQAESRVRSTLTSEPPETVDQRVARLIQEVTERDRQQLPNLLGSDTEELRSSLGLRTLSALLQRYVKLDKRGKEYALGRAYAWAERGYELTRHTIRELEEKESTTPEQKKQLTTLGFAFSMKLGKEKLGGVTEGTDIGDLAWMERQGITIQQYSIISRRLGAGIDSGTQGWLTIEKVGDVIPKTWEIIKETIPARKR